MKGLIKKEFNSKPMYNDKYIKSKINIYNNRVCKNFQHNKTLKDNEYFVYLSIILDSIFVNSDKEYYTQILLEECKYAIKNKKVINTINEDLDLSKSDDDESK